MKPKDMQRSKIYRAERRAADILALSDTSLDKLQWYTDKVTHSRWWNAKAPRDSFFITWTDGSRSAACANVTHSIPVHIEMQNQLGVLHHLAHLLIHLSPTGTDEVLHNARFAKTYVDMVERFFPEAITCLREELKGEKVKLTGWSPEAKAKAAERAWAKKRDTARARAEALIKQLENET